MKRQRPQRQSRPQRNFFPEQKKIQDNPYHMKEMLKSDIAMLEQENTWLKLKCNNMTELEQKVQIVLKQNAQLLSENEKMSRYLHQQKAENEMLKNKCDSLNAQKYEIADDCQKQKMKLLNELQNLEQELEDMEGLKAAEINDIQKQYQIDLQTFKRQFSNSENAYEMQIRKLNDQLSKKQKQIRQNGNKFKKISTETDHDILKLKEERDHLRKQFIINEKDHIEQLEQLKAKLESNRIEELQALKRLHLTNLEEAKMENSKLREDIDAKNREIQQMGNNLSRQRTYYEDSIHLLKKDIESYRQQLVQTDKIGRNQIGELKQKLEFMHENEIKEIQAKQQSQIRALEEELAKMQMINRNKNIQIEKLIKQKSATFSYYDSQVNRGKDEYSVLMDRFKDMDFKYSESLKQATNKIIQKEKHISYLEDIVSSQKDNAETENHSLQTFIENLKQELSNEKMISKQKQQALKEEASYIRHQLNEATLDAEQKKIDYQRLISELKSELSGTSTQLNTKSQVLVSKTKILEKQNEGLKNNIALKDKEIKNMVERLKASTERESKLAAQIDELRSKMIKKDQKSNEAIFEQKVRMENSFAFTLDNLKNDHEAALRLQANKQRSLQQALKKKQTELNQLLLRYKRMTEELQILTEQQANKKDITLKFPGATSDLIATKNIFDVYLKAKVLDVCGDALKQNKTQ